jgi:hypothetical protein
MRKLRLLSTVAASLLLSVGVAAAQSPNIQGQSSQAPGRAPAAQQSAPAEKVAPPMHAGERKAPETTGQSSQEMKPGAAGSSASEKAGERKGSTNGQSSTQMKPGESKPGTSGQSSKDSSSGANSKMNNSASEKSNSNMKENKAEGASGSKMNQSTTEKKSTTTTGQGAAAGQAKLSSEQRTKITTVIKSQKVERVEPSKLNVSIHVGARVPASVRFHPLPAEVVTIYPEWRGYDYILVGDQIVILDPRSHEIVFIIEA